jgi:hypothetical protein
MRKCIPLIWFREGTMASCVEESNKLSAAQWGLCSMEVVTDVKLILLNVRIEMSYSISGIFTLE